MGYQQGGVGKPGRGGAGGSGPNRHRGKKPSLLGGNTDKGPFVRGVGEGETRLQQRSRQRDA